MQGGGGGNHRQASSYIVQQASGSKSLQQPQQQLPPHNSSPSIGGMLTSRHLANTTTTTTATTTATSRNPSSGNGRGGNFMTNFMANKLPIAGSIFPSIKQQHQHHKQQQQQQVLVSNKNHSNNSTHHHHHHHISPRQQQQQQQQQPSNLQQVQAGDYRSSDSSASGAQMNALDKQTNSCPQRQQQIPSSLPLRYIQNEQPYPASEHLVAANEPQESHKSRVERANCANHFNDSQLSHRFKDPQDQMNPQRHQHPGQMQAQNQQSAMGSSSAHGPKISPTSKAPSQQERAFHVNFNRDGHNGAADDELAGESRKKKYLTAKYGQQQMNLIKKRLKIETWLYEQLKELASGTKSEAEMEDVDIDLDELLDMDDDETRRRWLKKTLEPFDDLKADRVETFIGQVIEQSKLL